MKVNSEYVVTASVVSEATGVVDVGSCSLADIIFTSQGRCDVEAPLSDNGFMPDFSDKLINIRATSQTDCKNDLTNARAILKNDKPLRLRGGDSDLDDNDTGSVDNGSNSTMMDSAPSTSAKGAKKRKRNDSPVESGLVLDGIMSENRSIEGHIKDCFVLLNDMETVGKIGAKWTQGIESHLHKIQSCCTSIAMVAIAKQLSSVVNTRRQNPNCRTPITESKSACNRIELRMLRLQLPRTLAPRSIAR